MPIEVNCPQCGRLLRAPDAAAGRRAKCPECAGTVAIPGGVLDAEEFGGGAVVDYDAGPGRSSGAGRPARRPPDPGEFEDDFDDFDAMFGPVAPRNSSYGGPPQVPVGRSSAAGLKPCPVCGEMIQARAVRCRYCGEDLHAGPSRGSYRRRADDSADGLATASLVLGIISLLGCVSPVTAPLAIIFGIMHQGQARENGQTPSGQATAGIVCAVISLVFLALFILMILVA